MKKSKRERAFGEELDMITIGGINCSPVSPEECLKMMIDQCKKDSPNTDLWIHMSCGIYHSKKIKS